MAEFVGRILSQFTAARGWQIMRRGRYKRGRRAGRHRERRRIVADSKRGL